MIIKYKLDKSFGPVASFAGIVLFIAGLLMVYFSLLGLILIALGAFIGFTFTCSIIDIKNKKVRFLNVLFGFIPTGEWIQISDRMKLQIKKSKKVYRTYSRGNRTLDSDYSDYRIIIINSNGKQIMELAKFDSKDKAQIELNEIQNQLFQQN